MDVKQKLDIEIKRKKAIECRYRKAIANHLNLDQIQTELEEMSGECDNVRWWFSDGDETMLNELIGDEEETYELRSAFSMLSAECEQMYNDICDEWIPEFFDDFFGRIAGDTFGLMGFDSFEGDYFGLTDRWEEEHAQEECSKRLQKFTKAQLLDGAHVCFRVAVNYISLKNRYENLKAYIDILNGKNSGLLKTVKQIEDLYERVSEEYPSRQDADEFKRLVNSLPPETWVQ